MSRKKFFEKLTNEQLERLRTYYENNILWDNNRLIFTPHALHRLKFDFDDADIEKIIKKKYHLETLDDLLMWFESRFEKGIKDEILEWSPQSPTFGIFCHRISRWCLCIKNNKIITIINLDSKRRKRGGTSYLSSLAISLRDKIINGSIKNFNLRR